jgi:WD40 repeat protein
VTGRPSPYVGLVPFSEQDAAWFYGRSGEQRIIAANLRSSRLTLLYGASGVGKTSVLMAGVVADLRRQVDGHRQTAAVPVSPSGVELRDSTPLAVAVFSAWRDLPLPGVAAAIHAAVEEATGESLAPWDGQEPFVEAIRRWTRDVHQVLLVLDQFEEYFLYHPEGAARGAFDQVFAQVVNDPDLRVHVLVALREDAWAQLDRFKGRIPLLFDNYLRVAYLAPAEAHEAILGPIDHYNALSTTEAPVMIEPELVDRVLRDVRTGRLALAHGRAPFAAAADADDEGRVETPYLQLVMERLWDAAATRWTAAGGERALTLGLLEELGGADAIVAGHLHDALGAMPEDDQEIAAAVFEFLVTPSKTKIAHRASDLAHFTKRPVADVERVLTALTGRSRILREVPSAEATVEAVRFELYHDVLAEALLKWCSERAELREQAAIEERLREEHVARRRRRRRRLLRVLQIGGVLALVAVGVWSLFLRPPSTGAGDPPGQRAKLIAAQAERNLVTERATDPLRALLLARAAVARAPVAEARTALDDSVAGSSVRAILGSGVPRRCPVGCTLGRSTEQETMEAKVSTNTNAYAGDISFTHDNRVAAIVGRQVLLWDPRSGRSERLPIPGDVAGINALADGTMLYARAMSHASVAAAHREPAPSRGAPVWLRPRPGSAASVSRDERYAAFPTHVWDVVVVRRIADNRAVARFRAPRRSRVTSVAFDPRDPGTLAIAGRSLWLWHWRTGRVTQRPRHAPATSVSSLRYSLHGGLLAALGIDGTVEAWDGRTYDHRFWKRPLTGPRIALARMLLSPGGQRVLTIEGRIIVARSGTDGSLATAFSGPTDSVRSASFSRDGSRVVTAQADGVARVWDAAAGTVLQELRGHDGGVLNAAFAPDGHHVVTIGQDRTLRLWDLDARVVAATPAGGAFATVPGQGGTGVVVRTAGARALASSPGGSRLRPVGQGRAHHGTWALTWKGGQARPPGTGPASVRASLSADGKRLAALEGSRLLVWGTRSPIPHRLLLRSSSRAEPVSSCSTWMPIGSWRPVATSAARSTRMTRASNSGGGRCSRPP